MSRFVRANRIEDTVDEEKVLSQCLPELGGHRPQAIEGPHFQASLDNVRRCEKRQAVGPDLPHDFE
jgi:hypothetical protein